MPRHEARVDVAKSEDVLAELPPASRHCPLNRSVEARVPPVATPRRARHVISAN
jgi:hypothetical protein